MYFNDRGRISKKRIVKKLESSFEYLGTDKPLITILIKRLDEFSKSIQYYEWKEIIHTDQYYSEEIIFNAPKILIKK